MLYTLKMTLSGSKSLPGHCPWTPRSLALRFIGFTHSACHYYSQLFSTTQIGLATTLHTKDTVRAPLPHPHSDLVPTGVCR